MIVFKIFHIPTNQYVKSMTECYVIDRYSNSSKIVLNKKGKHWNTLTGVTDAFQTTLVKNCKNTKLNFEDFEIHELTLQVTKKFKA